MKPIQMLKGTDRRTRTERPSGFSFFLKGIELIQGCIRSIGTALVPKSKLGNESGARPASRRDRWKRRVIRSSWLYCAAILALVVLMRWSGDRWWPATVLMFGPRWLLGLPFVVLLPVAVFTTRKALWPLAISLALVLGPLMGLCMPWLSLIAPEPTGPRIRVLTCNIHYNQLDAQALSLLITQTDPDVVALQGWIGKHKSIVFGEGDWHLRRDGELCLGCRYPIRKVDVAGGPWFKDGRGALARYNVEWPPRDIHFFNLHLASPRDALEEVAHEPIEAGAIMRANSDLRQSQSEIVWNWTRDLDSPILLGGDFNTPPESAIYGKFWSPYHNGFCESGMGWGHTFFTRRAVVRIDHQLAGPGWQCRSCWVGPDVGSPHRPLIADWVWVGFPD